MPRKPARQPRPLTLGSRPGAVGQRTLTPLSASRSTSQRFYQCMACGAPADPVYGSGNGSWCPACHEQDTIGWAEGRLPDPQLYGQWFLAQRAEDSKPTPKSDPVSPLLHGALIMKTAQLHTGPYCCPKCYMNFNLIAEEVLKCDRCGGPLLSGTVNDYYVGAADDQDEE